MDSTTLADRARLRKGSDPGCCEGCTAAANRTGSSAAAALPACTAQRCAGDESAGLRRPPSADIQAYAVPAMEETAQCEGGTSYVGDTRLTVGQLLEALADRRSAGELLQRFPCLNPQDIRDAVDYAAHQGLLGKSRRPERVRAATVIATAR